MSFSDDVKKELLDSKLKGNCCRRAFLFGALMGAEDDGQKITLKISNLESAEYIKELIAGVLKRPFEETTINRGFCKMSILQFSSPAASKFLESCDNIDEDRKSVV